MTPYYDDGTCVIYHGDCRELAASLPKVDLILTDPPFFMPAQHYASRSKWQRSWGDTSILASWWEGTLEVLVPRLKDTGQILAFCDDESYPVFYPSIYRRFDLLASLIWDKSAIGMGVRWRHSHELLISGTWKASKWRGGGSRSDVLRVRSVPSRDRLHPVDKPVDLLSQLIQPTTDGGDIVLDPFLGGGSTLVAAKLLGRKAIGIEIEERYCEVAARRLSQGVLALDLEPPGLAMPLPNSGDSP